VATRGTRFTEAITAGPSTPSSFVAIFTSTYPLAFAGYRSVSESRTLVTELLAQNGILCAGFHSNPYTSSRSGYDRGFHHFAEFGLQEDAPHAPGAWRFSRLARRWRGVARAYTARAPYASAPTVTCAAIRWMRGAKRPFFVWLHYMDVHHPYYPPGDFIRQVGGRPASQHQMVVLEKKLRNPETIDSSSLERLVELYDASIAYSDAAVGDLLAALSDLGIRDETALILAADHGEEFKEHGGTSHKAKLYDELLRVPLVIQIPWLATESVVHDQVSLLDIAPTILDLFELPPADEYAGQSLVPLCGGAGPDPRHLFSECYHQDGRVRFSDTEGSPLVSVRTPEWKYIWDGQSGAEELYDLARDPGEQDNIAVSACEKRAELARIVQEHLGSLTRSDSVQEGPRTTMDGDLLSERLRELGYLD
jgi:arylsulfatase A-like enzyme